MGDGKRGRLMGDPDEFIDPDDRNLEQVFKDLNVEVVRVKKGEIEKMSQGGSVVAKMSLEAEAKMRSLEVARKLIEEKGQKGRLSPNMAISHTKEELESMVARGLNIHEMAKELGVSVATMSALRQFHGIPSRQKRRTKKKEQNVAKVTEPVTEAPQNATFVGQNVAEAPDIIIAKKTIKTSANAAGGEVLGTAKMLEKLGELPVIVEIKVMEDTDGT